MFRSGIALTDMVDRGKVLTLDELRSKESDNTDSFIFRPAKTIEEAESFARNTYGMESNKSNLNLEALNEVNRSIYELQKEFGSIKVPMLYDIPASNIYAEAAPWGMGFNQSMLNQPALLKELLDKDMATRFHPAGCNSIKSIVDHEIAHVLTLNDISFGLEKATELTEKAGNIMARYTKSIDIDDLDRTLISRYAVEELAEFLAECFTMARNGTVSNKYANEIYDLMKERYGVKP